MGIKEKCVDLIWQTWVRRAFPSYRDDKLKIYYKRPLLIAQRGDIAGVRLLRTISKTSRKNASSIILEIQEIVKNVYWDSSRNTVTDNFEVTIVDPNFYGIDWLVLKDEEGLQQTPPEQGGKAAPQMDRQ